jgi:hypothetical protein
LHFSIPTFQNWRFQPIVALLREAVNDLSGFVNNLNSRGPLRIDEKANPISASPVP